MTSPILVTGGTGRLGRHVVAGLRDAGHDVRSLSRHPLPSVPGIEYVTGDLFKNEGIEAALDGVEVVVNCAGNSNLNLDEDQAQLRNLISAASSAGVRHLVHISVVGADRIPVAGRIDRMTSGYFWAKLACEQIVADSGIPWTTLRATQFYDGFLVVAEKLSKLPIMPVFAGYRFQPIDEREVAATIVGSAVGAPGGMVPEMGGPRIYPMADLIREYLRATGKRRLIVPMPVPGKAAAAIRAGANLTPERAVGQRTWEAFLVERLGSADHHRISGLA